MALPLLLRAEPWLIAPVFLSQPWEGRAGGLCREPHCPVSQPQPSPLLGPL